MLTRCNEIDLLCEISPQELDPTSKDSITIARELGFRLLWIDALCTYQDDEKWKVKELGDIGKIYRNATLTIIFSAARNVEEWMLHRISSTLGRVGLVDGQPRLVFSFRVAEDR
ncbi:het domain containing protein [Paraphaeosphaeria sporulosa]